MAQDPLAIVGGRSKTRVPEEGEVSPTRVLVLALLLPLAGTGCSAGPSGTTVPAHDPVSDSTSAPASAPASPVPRPGGPSFRPVPVPSAPMDRLERPIAARLAARAARDGLTLDYLACPSWDGRMPERIRCTGYFDGVTASVRVRLTSLPGGSVGFDANIGKGVVSTHRLVEQLRGRGYRDVDCGDRAAYPARVGLRLVCAVSRHGHRSFVVATVTSRAGGVTIQGS